ncbi:hypothetical protein HS088_TW14G00867 [Tripterygium wilfordii]|uniref:Uncharacterized protein n=1 Tax=Tripterygium wilfordii TaxID=458696 RepID=A0A7J7CRI8_TRIWF|nr:hypothetical protein HS088_TW14G00867 [Tripterygium wilfordii]
MVLTYICSFCDRTMVTDFSVYNGFWNPIFSGSRTIKSNGCLRNLNNELLVCYTNACMIKELKAQNHRSFCYCTVTVGHQSTTQKEKGKADQICSTLGKFKDILADVFTEDFI